jgi:hypothetical protein
MAEYREEVEKYLSGLFKKPVRLVRILPIGAEPGEKELKGFGYGKPYAVDYIVEGDMKSSVLSSMKVQKGFGHDTFADRAAGILWQNMAFNTLPKHVRSLDAGFFTKYGGLKSAGDADEFFILMDRVGGLEYYRDLDRIRDTHYFHPLDVDRALALSDYLVYIHGQKHDDPVLYRRRVRELVGGPNGLQSIELEDTVTGEQSSLAATGCFIFIGFQPNSGLIKGHFRHDASGYVITDERMMTSIPGLFAAGDLRVQLTRQVTTAVGDATTAAIAVEKYLTDRRAALAAAAEGSGAAARV